HHCADRGGRRGGGRARSEDRPRGGLPPDARRAVGGAAARPAALRAGAGRPATASRRRARLGQRRVPRAVGGDDERAPFRTRRRMVTAERVWSALDEVADPEIPVISLVELGVVRDVRVEGQYVSVTLTPTFLGCPALDAMRQALEEKLAGIGADPHVTVDHGDAWTTDRMTAAGREKLG